jgi:hypothetical protein
MEASWHTLSAVTKPPEGRPARPCTPCWGDPMSTEPFLACVRAQTGQTHGRVCVRHKGRGAWFAEGGEVGGSK